MIKRQMMKWCMDQLLSNCPVWFLCFLVLTIKADRIILKQENIFEDSWFGVSAYLGGNCVTKHIL